MSRKVTYAEIRSAYLERYPSAAPAEAGKIDSISASAESGQIDSIQASAFKGFAAVAGKLQWVQALEHFYQAGSLIVKDDFVQVVEDDAKRLFAAGRALFISDEEVAKAQSGKAA